MNDKSRLEKNTRPGSNSFCEFCLSSMQGMRHEMEDEHSLIPQIGNLRKWSFFAVFDGHGGTLCAEKSAKYLVIHILKCIFQEANIKVDDFDNVENLRLESSQEEKINKLNPNQITDAIKKGFISMDNELHKLEAIVNEEDSSGTTVISTLITPKYIFLINCGDSRGILIRENKIELSTFDHKPTILKERQRIQNAGGMIALHRVNGGLATSRGLGDFEYKNVPELKVYQQFVTPEPEIYILDRSVNQVAETKDYDHIVIACDGIWDVMKNEEVRKFVIEKDQDFKTITESLLDTSLEKGSRDNMSVILIRLKSG